jgi:hypothetical protein
MRTVWIVTVLLLGSVAWPKTYSVDRNAVGAMR